jgi:hypothetical protein
MSLSSVVLHDKLSNLKGTVCLHVSIIIIHKYSVCGVCVVHDQITCTKMIT